MKKITLLMVLIIGMVIHTFSQTPHSDTLSINNIKALVRAGGVQFLENDTNYTLSGSNPHPIYQYPNGSGKNTIFSSSLWIGGSDIDSNLKLAAESFNQNGTDFWTGPLTMDGLASTTSANATLWDKVWKINRQDLVNYLNSAAYPSNPPAFVINWPAHGDTVLHQSYQLAPFVDLNNNGKYEPLLGDYPKIYGDQCIFFIINDQKIHNETAGIPIGAEIHVFAYAFNNPTDSALNNAVFYKYKIINRSTYTLNNSYIGLFADIDIGNATDDYVASDVGRSTFYGYNGMPLDSVYGLNPPAQGVTILGGPTMDPDLLDNPILDISGNPTITSVNGLNFGNGIVDDERFGMRRFLSYNNDYNPVNGEPNKAMDYYRYLRGIWKDGRVMTYGGNGTNPVSASNPKCDYMFPGYTDPLFLGTGGITVPGADWTDNNSGITSLDKRSLASMGPFTLIPESIHFVDVVYTTGSYYDTVNNPYASVEILKQRIDHIRDLFKNSPEVFQAYVGVTEKNELKFNIYPNPASDYLVVEGIGFKKLNFSIYNIVGQSVIAGNLDNNSSKINIASLNSGIYFIKINTESKTETIKFVKR